MMNVAYRVRILPKKKEGKLPQYSIGLGGGGGRW